MWPGACGAAGMDVQVAELPAEGEMLLGGEMLVAEEDHEIFRQRPMDLVGGLVAERLRQIDAADLGADDRRQLVERDRLVGGAVGLRVLVTRPAALVQSLGHWQCSRLFLL